jgi:hypothetical protein
MRRNSHLSRIFVNDGFISQIADWRAVGSSSFLLKPFLELRPSPVRSRSKQVWFLCAEVNSQAKSSEFVLNESRSFDPLSSRSELLLLVSPLIEANEK